MIPLKTTLAPSGAQSLQALRVDVLLAVVGITVAKVSIVSVVLIKEDLVFFYPNQGIFETLSEVLSYTSDVNIKAIVFLY